MLYRYFIPGVKGGGKKAPKFITEARDIRENQDFLILAWQIALWSSVAHNGTFLASFCAITGILGLDIWNGRVFVAVFFFSIKLQGMSVTVLELKLWLQISQSCSSRQWACPVMLQLHGLISTWLGSVCDIMVCWFNKTCLFLDSAQSQCPLVCDMEELCPLRWGMRNGRVMVSWSLSWLYKYILHLKRF